MIQQVKRSAGRSNLQQGFTLIELTLSMTFISVLLLTIALTIMQISTIYNRGMTLKEVNQSARNISEDLQRTVTTVGDYDLEIDGNKNFFVISRNGVELGGRLCLGSYSYIWNTAAGIEAVVKNKSGIDKGLVARTGSANPASTSMSDLVRFQKIPDTARYYCEKTQSPVVTPASAHIRAADATLATELVRAGDRNIAIQKLVIDDTQLDPVSGQGLYRVAYTLGTGDTSAINTAKTACLPPDDPNSNIEYCNVQRFMVVLRTGSGVN